LDFTLNEGIVKVFFLPGRSLQQRRLAAVADIQIDIVFAGADNALAPGICRRFEQTV
jgi:hypothetical protein